MSIFINQMVELKIEIQTCEHADDIAIFCGPPYNKALCNDCFFD